LDDLRGWPELSVLDPLMIQAMASDADRVMQIIELFAVEPDSFLRTPAETFGPSRKANRDAARPHPVFNNNFDLLFFAA